MVCRKCGSEVGEDVKFCPYCGEKIEDCTVSGEYETDDIKKNFSDTVEKIDYEQTEQEDVENRKGLIAVAYIVLQVMLYFGMTKIIYPLIRVSFDEEKPVNVSDLIALLLVTIALIGLKYVNKKLRKDDFEGLIFSYCKPSIYIAVTFVIKAIFYVYMMYYVVLTLQILDEAYGILGWNKVMVYDAAETACKALFGRLIIKIISVYSVKDDFLKSRLKDRINIGGVFLVETKAVARIWDKYIANHPNGAVIAYVVIFTCFLKAAWHWSKSFYPELAQRGLEDKGFWGVLLIPFMVWALMFIMELKCPSTANILVPKGYETVIKIISNIISVVALVGILRYGITIFYNLYHAYQDIGKQIGWGLLSDVSEPVCNFWLFYYLCILVGLIDQPQEKNEQGGFKAVLRKIVHKKADEKELENENM